MGPVLSEVVNPLRATACAIVWCTAKSEVWFTVTWNLQGLFDTTIGQGGGARWPYKPTILYTLSVYMLAYTCKCIYQVVQQGFSQDQNLNFCGGDDVSDNNATQPCSGRALHRVYLCAPALCSVSRGLCHSARRHHWRWWLSAALPINAMPNDWL